MNRRLLNQYEELTYEALLRACKTDGARVFPKVRLADVFALENSGVTSTHFGYGLRSHFDFSVTDRDYQPLFSVEFDGPLHKTSQVQRRRDALKNELCDRFNHGLLRINSKYLTPSYRGLDLLTFFVDAWFLEEAFNEAQSRGAIPWDEPFDIMSIYSDGTRGSNKWPYWLSLDVQMALQQLHDAGRIGQMVPSHHVGMDSEGNCRCLSWIVMDARTVLFTLTGMRAQRMRAVCESELVSKLAMFDLYAKVQQVLGGTRGCLVDRKTFFTNRLPAFQDRFELLDAAWIEPTV